jgi:hypothetical protein
MPVTHAGSHTPLKPAWQPFAPVLAQLRAESAVHFGTGDVRLEPVAYQERPYSHVLRVGVCRRGFDTPDLFVFVKLFKPKLLDGGADKMRRRIVHDFEVSRRIFEALAATDSDAAAVRPLACYVDHLAIVSEEAPGATLLAHLNAHARWFPSSESLRQATLALSRVGRWLRAFQSIDPGTGCVDLDELREYVDVRLQRLVEHHVLRDAYRARVLRHLDSLARQIRPHELGDVIVHADLAPGNVLVSPNRVVVLDFAMVQRGSTLHDLTRLHVQLDALKAKPQFRASVVSALQHALREGFDPALTPQRPLFRYLELLHRVNHLGSLSLNREGLLASAVSSRVRRLHRDWIDRELAAGERQRAEAAS